MIKPFPGTVLENMIKFDPRASSYGGRVSSSILDVAKKAGVTKSTVSRVLNNQPHVSKTTKEKVLKAIRELDFHPNPYARSIVSGKTRTVGLLVPNLSSSFYVEIVEGIMDEISSQDYGLLIYKSEGKDEEILKRVFYKSKTDGIITITPRFREKSFVDAFKDSLPFVLINHRNTEIEAPYVCFNNFNGGYMAAKFLLELGHRDIACIAGRLSSQSTRDRFNGLKKALEEADVPFDKFWIKIKGEDFEDSIAEIIMRWAETERVPTAIFTYNDLTAFDAIAVLRELGLSVPRDVSIVGFDNIRMARYSRPPLTTINQSMERIGKMGSRMLLELIRGGALEQKKITIEPELIIRDSCEKPILRRRA